MDSPVANGIKRSESATQPYPTRQAITTPPASHAKGDWGLKRPLPTKTTSKTSTPHIRINAIDNRAHVTDFESAANHTRNLAKWQEMNIVMRRKEAMSDQAAGGQPSVFEDSVDTTVHDGPTTTQPSASRRGPPRWKVKGPWLASMSEFDFQRYLDKNLRSAEQRAGFLDHVAKVYSRQKRSDALARMRESGELGSDTGDALRLDAELEKAASVAPAELEEHIRLLRQNHNSINSDLGKLIQDYFDMPAAGRAYTGHNAMTTTDPPPPTHPSAGISYLRTDAWMDNHPNFGPQVSRPAVRARVIRPKTFANISLERAQLGVGGFVANDRPPSKHIRDDRNPDSANAQTFKNNYDKIGGNKIWVHAVNGYVNPNGLVRLEITRATPESIEIKTGNINPHRSARNADVRFVSEGLLGNKAGAGSSQSTPQPGFGDRGFGDNEVRRIRESMKAENDEGLAQFKTLFKEFNRKNASRPSN